MSIDNSFGNGVIKNMNTLVRSEDQLIQNVQETTNTAPEQQSKNPALNPHILKLFEDPRVKEKMIVIIDKL